MLISMLYLISPPLELRAYPVFDLYKLVNNASPRYYSDVPFGCNIYNLTNLNESFNSCQKNYDLTGATAQSVLALRDLAHTILDSNLTLLPNLIEQTPNTTLVDHFSVLEISLTKTTIFSFFFHLF